MKSVASGTDYGLGPDTDPNQAPNPFTCDMFYTFTPLSQTSWHTKLLQFHSFGSGIWIVFCAFLQEKETLSPLPLVLIPPFATLILVKTRVKRVNWNVDELLLKSFVEKTCDDEAVEHYLAQQQFAEFPLVWSLPIDATSCQ